MILNNLFALMKADLEKTQFFFLFIHLFLLIRYLFHRNWIGALVYVIWSKILICLGIFQSAARLFGSSISSKDLISVSGVSYDKGSKGFVCLSTDRNIYIYIASIHTQKHIYILTCKHRSSKAPEWLEYVGFYWIVFI